MSWTPQGSTWNVYCETSQGLIHGKKPEKLKSAVSWHFVRALLQWAVDNFPFGRSNQIDPLQKRPVLSLASVLSVVPKVGDTEPQIIYKSGIVGNFCALWLLPVCQCTDCHGTDFAYHRHTSNFWVMMSEGSSMQPQYNSINFNRSGWKIIVLSKSREDTEWVSYGEIRIMAASMLLIFKLYVPILAKHVEKVLQKYILSLALSKKHGERRSPGQQYNSPTALLVWRSQLLGMTAHSDSIGHQNFSSGILSMSCIHWQWTIALSELIQAFVNLQCGGAELWLGLFDLIVERGWLQKRKPFCESKTETQS